MSASGVWLQSHRRYWYWWSQYYTAHLRKSLRLSLAASWNIRVRRRVWYQKGDWCRIPSKVHYQKFMLVLPEELLLHDANVWIRIRIYSHSRPTVRFASMCIYVSHGPYHYKVRCIVPSDICFLWRSQKNLSQSNDFLDSTIFPNHQPELATCFRIYSLPQNLSVEFICRVIYNSQYM